MTKVNLAIALVFFNSFAYGQARSSDGVIPLRPDNWSFRPGSVEFSAAGNAGTKDATMKILDGRGTVTLKGVDFSDGTIEFDLLPAEKQFSSMYFRRKDSLESECFYYRVDRMGMPQAIQYAPIIGGVNCWNLYDRYQTTALWQQNKPIHTKLVVSGRRLRVYVDHSAAPALEVPRLEGNTTHGSICFQGAGTLSNIVVRQGQVEGLPATEGIDPAAYDPHYIRHWLVTQPDSIPRGIDFSYTLMPDSQRVWQPVTSEWMGLVNLTRLYPPKENRRRVVFLKTILHSDQARTCLLQLGFLNEIWVWLNGRWLYVDKNLYGEPIAKQRGRISLENSTVTIPLERGDNELMIAAGNFFYGWGIMARLPEMEGITFK